MNRTTNLLLIATILVVSLLPVVHSASSSLNGEVFVAAGTSGTNALPSSRTTNTTVLVQSNAGDGTNAFRVNATVTHITGNLMEVQNNGTNVFTIGTDGGTTSTTLRHPAAPFSYVFNQVEPLIQWALMEVNYDDGTNVADVSVFANLERGPTIIGYGDAYAYLFALYPGEDDGPPYIFGTRTNLSAYNLAEFKNNMTNKFVIDPFGKATATEGFSSTASDAAVTIAATGWTNTFNKNAVVYMDGTGLTFTVYNNALTPVYTNSVTLTGATVLLQPSGKVIITAGTLGVGRATPF